MPYSARDKALIGIGGVTGAGIIAWRTLFPWIGYDLQMMKTGVKMKKKLESGIVNKRFIVDMFEGHAAEQPNKPLLIFEDRIYTYGFMNQQACRVANIAQKWGLKLGDTVAIYFQNCPAFIWTFLGLLKLGLGVAFINSNIRGQPLLHSIKASEAKVLIMGPEDELFTSVDEIRSNLSIPVYLSGMTNRTVPTSYISWDDLMLGAEQSEINKCVRAEMTLLSPCIYIYTSGTTGLPKPAIVNVAKSVGYSTFLQLAGVEKNDIVYTMTPLYHSAAVLSLFSVFDVGATILLRKKFSAHHYFPDCRRHKVTIAQYIGELCRYLLALPETPEDKNHGIKRMIGNGLRPDIWEKFQKRFNIPKIVEFFGATEGTSAMVNLSDRVGAVGRLSPFINYLDVAKKFIVKFDPETEQPWRDENGFCKQCAIGEAGILLATIPPIYVDGFYKGGKEVNEKKIVRNAFEKGDSYFNYGDLMYLDKDYFVYFKDRVGDTFRWKGENVSTNEVANVLTKLDFIQDANVYGVEIPGTDGRAGMASLLLKDGLEFKESMLAKIYEHCSHNLPSYARPIFLRYIKSMPLTATMKQRKVDAVKEGFDPTNVKDPLYYVSAADKSYLPLTVATYPKVLKSKL